MYLCLCKGVRVRDVKQLLRQRCASVEEVMACTGAGTGCGSCLADLEALVAEAREDGEREVALAAK